MSRTNNASARPVATKTAAKKSPKKKAAPTQAVRALRELMAEHNMNKFALATAIKADPMRVTRLLLGRIGFSPDTSLRLGILFGNGTHFWTSLQAIDDAHEQDSSPRAKELRRTIAPVRRAADADS